MLQEKKYKKIGKQNQSPVVTVPGSATERQPKTMLNEQEKSNKIKEGLTLELVAPR
jgi:hypothetical protein